ncbi:MAG: 54S ribosomal protein L22, mitochondrial [Trichoglossum hirsutum]|nr:MAG: 54S ribosomal protein L22, mitochondrial [Trichoglossum hirsutum]
MSFRTSSRRLTRSAIALKTASSTQPQPQLQSLSSWPTPIFTLPLTSVRTIFNPFRRRSSESERNPVYSELLKQAPSTENPAQKSPFALKRGGLAESSIFDTPDAGPQPAQPTDSGAPVQLPNADAVLNPQPEQRRRWERKMVIRSLRSRGRLSKITQRKRTEREILSKSHFFKTSVKKLGPLARQIAGKTVDDAIVQMRFSKKKAAKEVLEQLEHARNEAIVRRGMGLGSVNDTKGEPVQIRLKDGKKKVITDRTQLYIDQAWVGRGPYGKEPDFRARGQIYMMRPPKTSLSVILKEEATRIREAVRREEKRKRKPVWVPLPNRPITAQRPYYSW